MDREPQPGSPEHQEASLTAAVLRKTLNAAVQLAGVYGDRDAFYLTLQLSDCSVEVDTNPTTDQRTYPSGIGPNEDAHREALTSGEASLCLAFARP